MTCRFSFCAEENVRAFDRELRAFERTWIGRGKLIFDVELLSW